MTRGIKTDVGQSKVYTDSMGNAENAFRNIENQLEDYKNTNSTQETKLKSLETQNEDLTAKMEKLDFDFGVSKAEIGKLEANLEISEGKILVFEEIERGKESFDSKEFLELKVKLEDLDGEKNNLVIDFDKSKADNGQLKDDINNLVEDLQRSKFELDEA